MTTSTKAMKKSGKKSAKQGAKKAQTKDPRGGLTAAGRKHFKEKEGANLKPGVTKKESEMTPEEMGRKGSFLRRHYANSRFDLQDTDGNPTRFALQARAWGEPVPKTDDAVKRLADKGTKLLEKAKAAKKAAKGGAAKKGGATKVSAKKSSAKKSGSKKGVAKKTAASK